MRVIAQLGRCRTALAEGCHGVCHQSLPCRGFVAASAAPAACSSGLSEAAAAALCCCSAASPACSSTLQKVGQPIKRGTDSRGSCGISPPLAKLKTGAARAAWAPAAALLLAPSPSDSLTSAGMSRLGRRRKPGGCLRPWAGMACVSRRSSGVSWSAEEPRRDRAGVPMAEAGREGSRSPAAGEAIAAADGGAEGAETPALANGASKSRSSPMPSKLPKLVSRPPPRGSTSCSCWWCAGPIPGDKSTEPTRFRPLAAAAAREHSKSTSNNPASSASLHAPQLLSALLTC